MSRYIDRLSPDAATDYRCWRRANRYTLADFPCKTASEIDDTLIELARRLASETPAARTAKLLEIFSEVNVVEASAVIEAILADLDLDAEVAGDPETIELQEWKPQGGGRCIGDIIEGLDAAIRILAMHGIPTNVPLDGTRTALLSLVNETAAATDTTPLTRRLHNAVLRSVLRDRRF